MGEYNYANKNHSLVIGKSNIGMETYSVAIGLENIADGEGSISMGTVNMAFGNNSLSIGRNNTSIKPYSVSIGLTNLADGPGSLSMGIENIAKGNQTVAMGFNNSVEDSYAVGVGNGNWVSGWAAVGMGALNVAEGKGAVAVGSQNTAKGDNSVAMGASNVADGAGAVAMGFDNHAKTDLTLAVGIGNTVQVPSTDCVGDAKQIIIDGKTVTFNPCTATALGNNNQVRGSFSFATGNSNRATGRASAAVGQLNNATGDFSFATGNDNLAEGYASSAVGSFNTATGAYSLAFGLSNKVRAFAGQGFGDDNKVHNAYNYVFGKGNVVGYEDEKAWSKEQVTTDGVVKDSKILFSKNLAVGFENEVFGRNNNAVGFNNQICLAGPRTIASSDCSAEENWFNDYLTASLTSPTVFDANDKYWYLFGAVFVRNGCECVLTETDEAAFWNLLWGGTVNFNVGDNEQKCTPIASYKLGSEVTWEYKEKPTGPWGFDKVKMTCSTSAGIEEYLDPGKNDVAVYNTPQTTPNNPKISTTWERERYNLGLCVDGMTQYVDHAGSFISFDTGMEITTCDPAARASTMCVNAVNLTIQECGECGGTWVDSNSTCTENPLWTSTTGTRLACTANRPEAECAGIGGINKNYGCVPTTYSCKTRNHLKRDIYDKDTCLGFGYLWGTWHAKGDAIHGRSADNAPEHSQIIINGNSVNDYPSNKALTFIPGWTKGMCESRKFTFKRTYCNANWDNFKNCMKRPDAPSGDSAVCCPSVMREGRLQLGVCVELEGRHPTDGGVNPRYYYSHGCVDVEDRKSGAYVRYSGAFGSNNKIGSSNAYAVGTFNLIEGPNNDYTLALGSGNLIKNGATAGSILLGADGVLSPADSGKIVHHADPCKGWYAVDLKCIYNETQPTTTKIPGRLLTEVGQLQRRRMHQRQLQVAQTSKRPIIKFSGFVDASVANVEVTTSSSDRRVKENIETADTSKNLKRINALRLAHYDYTAAFLEHTGRVDSSNLGFIAQEVEEVIPEAVTTFVRKVLYNKRGESLQTLESFKTINKALLFTEAIGAIQELSQELEKLKVEMKKIKSLLGRRKK